MFSWPLRFLSKSSRSELAKSYWTRFETGTLLHLVSTRPIGKGLPSKIRRETSESREINAKHQFTHQFPIIFFSCPKQHQSRQCCTADVKLPAWWISLCRTGPFSQPQKARLEPPGFWCWVKLWQSSTAASNGQVAPQQTKLMLVPPHPLAPAPWKTRLSPGNRQNPPRHGP